MVLLPDHVCERFGITSLRGERLGAVLPLIRGRLLDIGAGDNVLVRLHQERGLGDGASQSVGVDVVDWGGGCQIIESSARLPLDDATFDTVAFIACINHIPERREALVEARRVMRPGGTLIITMISRFIGEIGHKLWWYSEDKHRDIDEEEEMGLDRTEVLGLLRDAGFAGVDVTTFLYGLNTLYAARR
jgi:SAM-dependent methyltransferase